MNRDSKYKFKKILRLIIPYLWIIALTLLILYPQMRSRVYLTGYDSWFHMNQFYDTAMQFKTGHFSYFLSLFGFGQFGRIVNAVYGPGFVYIGGLILVLAKTWFHFELIQDFLSLVLCGSLFYILARKNHITRSISILMGMLYMMSDPVLSWIINQEFNGIEAILIPLVLIQGTQMARSHKIHPLALGVTMAVVFQTHMLTTLISSLILIPFFICAWIETNHANKLWKNLTLSICLTTVLTANVWGAMLNVFHQRLAPPVPAYKLGPGAAIIYMLPGHYFSVLGFAYTIIVVFFMICGMVSLLFWHRSNALYKIDLLLGIFVIWLSSIYFPWGLMRRVYPAFEYQIQFPKRFLPVGLALLFLAIGMLFSNNEVHLLGNQPQQFNRVLLTGIQAILIILVGASFMNQRLLFQRSFRIYQSHKVIDYNPFFNYHVTPKLAHQLRKAFRSPNMLKQGITLIHQDTPDYLPVRNSIYTYKEYRGNKMYRGVQHQLYSYSKHLHVQRHVANDQLIMTWNQHRIAYNDTLPMIKYRDTQVILNHHILYHPRINHIGEIQVSRVNQGENRLSIRYMTPAWFKALMALTIISWLIVVSRFIVWSYHKWL